jgi:hypothetical protein
MKNKQYPTLNSTPTKWLGILMMLYNNGCNAQVNGLLREQNAASWEDIAIQHHIQIGVDTWHLDKKLEPDVQSNYTSKDLLFLADSFPHGQYQNPSTWVKIDAEARKDNKVLRLRYDNNQSVGSRIDELSMDWGYNRLGVRAGVLGYKVSWCRTNDLDSPWIRENDPFCVVRSTSAPIKSSPGIQGYVNSQLGSFKIQAVAGIYRPMLLNYDSREFTTFALTDESKVIQNNKYGMSINAIDLDKGLELRLSYLRSNQMANYVTAHLPTHRVDQHVDVWYAAISTNINPSVNLRLSYFNSLENAQRKYPSGYTTPGDTYPDVFRNFTRNRTSQVLELNYQHTARDVISLAYSNYDANDNQLDADQLSLSNISYSRLLYDFNNTSTSIGWRRDWQKGIFTVVQFTQADLTQRYIAKVGVTSTKHSDSFGLAAGFRLGYSF